MNLLKKIKKISLVYYLQIIAVLVIFFYSGNATSSVQNIEEAGQAVPLNQKITIQSGNTALIYEAGDTLLLPGYLEPDLIKFALNTGNR